MRWLVLLIIIILFAMYLMPESEPVPADKSYIREPVGALRKAEGTEDDYLKATEERKKRMEQAIEDSSGGG